MKLRTHLKELNNKLEIAIDKTHTVKKPIMPNKEADPEEEKIRMESIKKWIQNFKYEIERLKLRDNKDDLEMKLEQSKQKRAELEKLKHDLEVELEDFKEEAKYNQPVTNSELKIWDEKIRKKKEMVEVGQKISDMWKQQEADAINAQANKKDNINELKAKAEEVKKLKQSIEAAKAEAKANAKRNKEKIREKENQVLSAKNEMNKLIDRLEEVNKQYKVNLHKLNQNERIIKYGLYDTRTGSESQLSISFNQSKSGALRGSQSQYRNSKYTKYQKGASNYKRDLSAVSTRNAGKKYGKNHTSGLLNSSTSEVDKSYGGRTSGRQFNKLKNIKNNSSVVYGNDPKSQLDLKQSQDSTMPDIKLSNQKPKTEADNIKAHRDLDDKANTREQKLPPAKNAAPANSDQLGDLKGLKVGQKKKIETSVKL